MLHVDVRTTDAFDRWLRDLRDNQARVAILSRLDRLSFGHLGDVKSLGAGLHELRIHQGAGYRVYLVQKGAKFVILLCGGDKSTQERDIRRARRMMEDVED